MGQTFTCLYNHIIFSTKHRKRLITPDLRPRLYDYMGGIIKHERCKLIAAGGMPDHVHLVVSLRATTCVAGLLRLVKTNSSGWVHDTFVEHAAFGWQTGYAAFSVSQSNLEEVVRYVEGQEEHHRKLTFEEEYVAFLKRHHLEYDEAELWD